MNAIKEKDIVKGKVTGIQNYGAFISLENGYNGLIHISEISYGFVKDINKYLKVGDIIYTEIVDIDKNTNNLKLSIKDIDYQNDGKKLKRMSETKNGFTPLKNNLNYWINKKIKEITEKI